MAYRPVAEPAAEPVAEPAAEPPAEPSAEPAIVSPEGCTAGSNVGWKEQYQGSVLFSFCKFFFFNFSHFMFICFLKFYYLLFFFIEVQGITSAASLIVPVLGMT